MEEPLNFEFCSDCGEYLLPEAGKVVVRDGLPVVLCSDCAGREKQDTESIVAAFEKKYNITPEK